MVRRGSGVVGVGLVVLVLLAEELSAESFGVVVAAVFEAEDVVVVVVGGAEQCLLVGPGVVRHSVRRVMVAGSRWMVWPRAGLDAGA